LDMLMYLIGIILVVVMEMRYI